MTAAQVLIVDDDPELRRFLTSEITSEGYSVIVAGTGEEALRQLRNHDVDLLLLDWSLPDLSGIEICRRMRASGVSTPVLMLTARDAVPERVEALDAGADDYLTKPFSIEELLARCRARLRRDTENESAQNAPKQLEFCGLLMNLTTRQVSRNGRPIQLTVREYELLRELLRLPGQVRQRQELLEAVWGAPFVGDSNLLDVYIRYLRKKVQRPGEPTLIQTVRGVGFVIRPGEVVG